MKKPPRSPALEPAVSLTILQHYGLVTPDNYHGDLEFKIPCPFHAERTPSCNVWLTEGRWHCFGCEQHGDIVALVEQIDQVDRLQALMKISKIRSGIPKEDLDIQVRVEDFRTDPKEAVIRAKSIFESIPPTDWRSINSHYMYDRGFLPRTLAHFDIRLNETAEYPIVMPMYSDGQFVGMVSRAIDDRPDKYRFNKGFRKRSQIIGDLKPGVVMVVEGTMDLMRTWQNGWTNVCCTLGWKMSVDQLTKIMSVATGIVGAQDSDVKGRSGYWDMKRRVGGKVPVARFPFPRSIHDPGDMTARRFPKRMDRAIERLASA